MLRITHNEIIFSNYEYAYDMLIIASNIANENRYLLHIHNDILINNLAICGFYSKHFSALECANSLSHNCKNIEEKADNLLIRNNQIVFLALAGKLDDALLMSNELYQLIINIDDADEYYLYYILNNYCVLLYLTEKKIEALKIFNILLTLNPLPRDNSYFNARSKYLEMLLKHTSSKSLLLNLDWNETLLKKYPNTIGKAWNFWGTLLLFSELQIWSDY